MENLFAVWSGQSLSARLNLLTAGVLGGQALAASDYIRKAADVTQKALAT
jgi:hypothetical protein